MCKIFCLLSIGGDPVVRRTLLAFGASPEQDCQFRDPTATGTSTT